jgi:uncharacterized damage-inducible protein DinB
MSSAALKELLHGIGAHADPIACLDGLTYEEAGRTIEDCPHTLGQLVFHMNYWMDYELRRIRGQRPRYPDHGAESFSAPPSPRDASDWNQLTERFAALLAEYAALADSPPEEMQRQIESARAEDLKRSGTLEAVLWQMVAHNSYHTGQVATIRRALGAWPPPKGGDIW